MHQKQILRKQRKYQWYRGYARGKRTDSILETRQVTRGRRCCSRSSVFFSVFKRAFKILSSRVFSLVKRRDGRISLSCLSFESRKVVALTLIIAMIAGTFLFPSTGQGASYTFVQTDWSGGTSVATATHDSNRTGWTYYASKDDNVVASTPGQLTLSTSSGTSTQTTDTHFNAGTNSDTEVTGSGDAGKVGLTAVETPIADRTDFAVGTTRFGVAFDSANDAIWAVNYGNSSVSKMSADTGSVIGTYSVGGGPIDAVYDSSSSAVWVSNHSSASVTKLNASTGDVIGTYGVGSGPWGIVFDSSTNSIWVANYYSNNVTKLNASNGSVIGTYSVGSNPYGITFDSYTNSIWAVNQGSNNVTKLNASTGAVVGTYAVGATALHGIVFDSSTNSVWVTSYNNASAIKLNASTGAVVGQYAVGASPHGIVFDSSTNSIWTANYSNGTVTKINASTGAQIGTITVGSTSVRVEDLAFDTATNSVWVVNSYNNTVTKLNITSGSVAGTYSTGSNPFKAAYDSSTGSLWVPSVNSNNITKFDAVTGDSLGTYLVGTNPYDVVFDPSTNSLWTANNGSNNVTKLNASDGSLVGTYSAGSGPSGIAFDSSANSIWITNSSSDNVTKLNASNGSLIGTYSVGDNPRAVVFDSYTNSMWIANATSNTVTKLNASNGSPIGTYSVGTAPYGVTFDSSTNSIWVSNLNSNNVTKLNASDGSLIGTYSAGTGAIAAAFESANNTIWVANYNSNNVTRLNASSGTLISTYPVGTNPRGILYEPLTDSMWVVNSTSGNIMKMSAITRATTYTPSSGTFTSSVVDLGQKSLPSTLDYSVTTPAGTTLTLDIRAGNTDTPDGTWTDWQTSIADEGDISALNGNRYIQFRANLATTDETVTPSLDALTVNHSYYGTGTLTSSVFDAGDVANLVYSMAWTETLPQGENDIRYQIRTSSDNATWTDWMGTDGTSGSYFSDNTGGDALPAALNTGENDRYMQYKIELVGNSHQTPTLSDATLTYVVNAAPEVQNVSASQGSNGNVTVTYEVRDVDTTTAPSPGNVTVTLQYCTASCTTPGGETWADATTVSGDVGAGVAVNESTFSSYSITWNPNTDYDEQYNGNFKIRVKADDGELANSDGYGSSSNFVLDTAAPAAGAIPIIVDASIVPATITLSATDDSSLEMRVGLSADLSDASYEAYSASKTVSLASNPDTVYVQYRDAYGNETSVSNASSTETPTLVMIQDISNTSTSEWRLFAAWQTVAEPAAGFANYKMYRSTDGSSYSLLTTINSRSVNYYIDSTAAFDTTYYYKVKMTDNDGNVSWFSSVLTGKANGTQDSGEGGGGSETTAPTISSISSTAVSTTQATILWDTNELANSTVGYSTIAGDFTNETGVATYLDSAGGAGQHRVVLSGLEPATTYYYRVLSSDPTGNQAADSDGGDGYTFTTLAGPAISGVALSNAANTQATITWNTDVAANTYVNYSTSVSGGSLVTPLESGDTELSTSHSITLTGLTSGTPYYFSVKSTDSSENLATDTNAGNFYTFITSSDSTGPVVSDAASSVTTYSKAVITWATDEQANSQVRYSTIAGGPYTSTVATSSYGEDHYVILTGLAADTTYYYRIVTSDLSGNTTTTAESSFSTEKDPEYQHDPLGAVTGVLASLVTDTVAYIAFASDQPALCTIDYGTLTETYTGSVSETAYNENHSIKISSLTPSTIYYYQVSCTDNLSNTVTANEETFTTKVVQVDSGAESDTTAPVVSDVSVDEVAGQSAALTWTTDEDANSIVSYGIESSDEFSSGNALVNAETVAYVTSHSVKLSGLIPGKKYLYKVSSADAKGNITVSEEKSFTTEEASFINSILVTVRDINETVITWITETATTSVVEYGKTVKYGSKQDSTKKTKEHEATLTGLSAGDTYHFRILGTDGDGILHATGDNTFVAKKQPDISSVEFRDITETETVVIFETDEDTIGTVFLFSEGEEIGSQGDAELKRDHEIKLTNLLPGKTYDATVKVWNESGVSFVVEESFKTQDDTQGPKMRDIKTELSLVAGGDKAQAVVTFVTDEPATAKLRYTRGRDGEETTVTVSSLPAESHTAVIKNFATGQAYFFHIDTEDRYSNKTTSSEFAFSTPKKKDSIIQLIGKNMSDIFSWVKYE